MATDTAEIPPGKKHALKKQASKSPWTAAALGFLITPLGYYYVGKTGWALINLFTLNFFLTGFLIVPIHVWMIISNARSELEANSWDI